MLRTFQGNIAKHADAMNTADVALVTGMGVVVDYADHTVSLPTAEIGTDVQFADKERIPTGIDAGRTNIPDYDPIFQNIAAGEMVKLVNYLPGEKFGTDQYNAGLVVNNVAAIGTDGKFVNATVESVYQYLGTYDDNGHTLAQFLVLNSARTN